MQGFRKSLGEGIVPAMNKREALKEKTKGIYNSKQLISLISYINLSNIST